MGVPGVFLSTLQAKPNQIKSNQNQIKSIKIKSNLFTSNLVNQLLCSLRLGRRMQVSSVQGLSRGLGEEFKLVHVENVPCMRPLSDRTFEYASAEATVWRRE